MAQEGHSPVLVFDSPVMVLHSLVLVFTQSSFIFLHQSSLHISVPAITRGTLVRTHELKREDD